MADNVLFIESCSNHNSKIFDYNVIPRLRELSKSLIVIIDNTWRTHLIFNLFDYYADIIVMSLTKYYSGGTTIMGACIFNETTKNIYDIAVKKNCYEGVHISPIIAQHLNIMMNQMETRIVNNSELTIKVLKLLQKSKPKYYEKYTFTVIQYRKQLSRQRL